MFPEGISQYTDIKSLVFMTFLFIISCLILREIIHFICLINLERFGVKTIYYPFIGSPRLVIVNSYADTMQPFKDLNREHWRKKALASNYPTRIGSNIFSLLRHDTIRKFLSVETQISFREPPQGYMNAGFFFLPTEQAFKEKSIFTEFFNYESLKQFHIPIFNVATKVLEEQTSKKNINNDYKTIDILDIIKQFMIYFSNWTIFGVKDGEGIPKLADGTEITFAVEEYFELIFSGYNNPLH